jgi:hypothetical protein
MFNLKRGAANRYGVARGFAWADLARAARPAGGVCRGLQMEDRASHRPVDSCLMFTVVFAIVLAGASLPAAAQDGSFAGIISEITCKGKAEIIEVGTNTKKDLKPEVDKHRPVASGDQLRCTGDGQIVVQLGGKSTTIIKEDKPGGKFALIRRSAILNSIAQDLDPAVTRGGSGQPIFSPPSDGAARASDLVVRWDPWPGVDQLTISVWPNATRQKFCCDGTFDGKKGSLESPELRKALMPLRDRNADDRELVLNISGSLLRDFLVAFSVLSATEETQLNGELATWESKNALLRHLGRAHIFSNYRLFTQAAEESEAALALAPESPYLLVLSIEAEHRTGNAAPLEELKRRLAAAQKKGSK